MAKELGFEGLLYNSLNAVGDRDFVSEDAARWLHEHDHRLQLDIRGTNPAAVQRFVRAARLLAAEPESVVMISV